MDTGKIVYTVYKFTNLNKKVKSSDSYQKKGLYMDIVRIDKLRKGKLVYYFKQNVV